MILDLFFQERRKQEIEGDALMEAWYVQRREKER
jgi:hypothetical protein